MKLSVIAGSRRRGITPDVQSPVSLVAADGEVVVGSSQSNFVGDGFWTDAGFTRAAAWAGPNPVGADYDGFDDVDFLPIVAWLVDFSGTGFYARMFDLGLNGMLPCAGSISLASNITHEKWAVVTDESHGGGTISTGNDPGVIGVSTGEEPSTVASYEGIIDAAVDWLATSDGPGRIHLFNFADPLLNGDMEGVYFPDDMVRGIMSGRPSPPAQWTTMDQYWFAGSGADDAGGSRSKLHYRLYGQPGSATIAQCARGSHYGSSMDCIRKAYPAGRRAPFGVWIENGAPYTETTSQAITPAQLQWAVWSTIVHGARGIYYFNHTFREDDPGTSSNNFNSNYYGGPGVAGTGIYAAAKAVNHHALTIASVLNSPFDGYFVYGDADGAIATPGFLTAVSSTNARSRYGGVDASCRWQPVQAQHYILATTREQDGTTGWPITCRMVDQGQSFAHPMFGGSDIAVTRGGGIPTGYCEFADTFATAATYKCWRID